ncbi:MAG: shikimate dehydrogenase [Planctomycetia bacterium]|nr:shikimate dehydrogenase [Planctomycetia bacterium]
MLCVTLAHGSHKRDILEHQKVADERIPLVELRLDLLRKPPELHRLLPTRPTPVIITVRRRSDGGFWQDTEEKRLRLLRNVIVEGADYVDLEMDIAASIPRYGKTKRIVSYHNFEETPRDLLGLHQQMMACDPDVVKIAANPQSISDVFRMIEFMKKVNRPGVKVPTVAISMGEMGVLTRILGGKYGAPFSYCSYSKGRRVAPGMVDYRTMRDVYGYDQINSETEIYGVIGHPIGHSLSPHIHNMAFRDRKLNKVYLPFLIPPSELATFIAKAPSLGIRGLSVTIPHKVEVIQELTNMEPAVEEINACNTILFQANAILGDNTDYLGALHSIERAMSTTSDVGNPISGKQALVLGAGGAGKAIAYGLRSRGANVTLCDGKDDLAEEVARKLRIHHCPWSERQDIFVDILCNCTPIGMFPNVDVMPIDMKALRNRMYVFDAVYNPENTWLLRAARERGCKVISGVEMFSEQAALQFKQFTGEDIPIATMRSFVDRAFASVKGC